MEGKLLNIFIKSYKASVLKDLDLTAPIPWVIVLLGFRNDCIFEIELDGKPRGIGGHLWRLSGTRVIGLEIPLNWPHGRCYRCLAGQSCGSEAAENAMVGGNKQG